MPIKLRQYQEDCISKILNAARIEKVKKQVIVLATGLGKTVVFGHLPSYVKKIGKKTLVLAHREELLDQAKDKIEMIDPSLKVEVEQAGRVASPDCDVVVASVATIGRENSSRLKKFIPEDYKLIVVDECLVSGTKIGDKNIEDIKIGDCVPSFNHKYNIIEYKPVLSLFKNPVKELMKINFNGGSFVCSPNHPIYTNKGYIPVLELAKLANCCSVMLYIIKQQSKKRVYQEKTSILRAVRLESIEVLKQTSDGKFGGLCKDGFVYNIEVADNNNYFANGALVHNCHHATSDSYRNVFKYFGVLKGDEYQQKGTLLLGVTATPNRSDHTGLDTIFDKITFSYTLWDGIKNGFLSDIKAYTVNSKTDISKVSTKMGDFSDKELQEAVNNENRNKLIVDTYRELTPGTKTLVFAAGVEHARTLNDYFLSANINSAFVFGNTPKAERKEIISKFKSGEIKVLVNCGVFCLSMDTEILTRDGWKVYSQLNKKDLVANYKQENGEILFLPPREIIKRKLYDFEKMVGIDNDKNSIRVTNTHRMIYKSLGQDKYLKTKAEDLLGRKFEYPTAGNSSIEYLTLPNEKIIDEKRFITANAYNYRKIGMSFEESVAEAKKTLEIKKNLHYKNPDELTVDDCRFIGFWIGDGSKNNLTRKGVEYTLCQSKVYPRAIKWVDSLLNRLKIDNIKRDKKSFYVWSLPRGTGGRNQKRNGVYYLEPYLNKNGSDYFWGLDREKLIALIEGLWMADGNHGTHFDIRKGSNRIDNTNTNLVDLLQAILVCRGISSSKSIHSRDTYKQGFINRLTFSINKTSRGITSLDENKRMTVLEHESREEVWCVKTDTKNLVTRRKGRVCIMGNTEGFDEPSIETIFMARPTKSSVLYSQMVGRGTRLFPGKDALNLIDFVDNTGKNKIITLPNLFGAKATLKGTKGKKITEVMEKVDKILEANPEADLEVIDDWSDETIDKVVKQVNILAGAVIPREVKENSKLSWEKYKDGYKIELPAKDESKTKVTIEPDMLGNYNILVKEFRKTTPSRFNGYSNWVTSSIKNIYSDSSISEVFKQGDDFINTTHPETAKLFNQDAQWRKDTPSEAQLKLMKKLKIPAPNGITKGQASILISQVINDRNAKRNRS